MQTSFSCKAIETNCNFHPPGDKMRQQVYFKISKLAVTEILLQSGFEKSSDDALNILTDIFCYYVVRKFSKVREMQCLRFGIHKIPLSFLVYAKSLEPYSYRHEEVKAFLSYQGFLSLYLKEKFKVEGSSMLQMLRVLPQRKIVLEVFNRKYRTNLNEIKSDTTETKDVDIDDFMMSFLERSMQEGGKEAEDYENHAELSNDLVKVGGTALLKLEEDTYEKFLVSKRKSFYDHFKEDVTFVDRISEDFMFFGKKVVDKHIFEDTG